MQQLLDLAEEMGLTVIERRGGSLGGYHHGSKTIRLSPNMSMRTTRCVLAHEIAHAVFGDVHTPFGPARARQERRANEWAALHLITPAAYATAEERRDGHRGAIAFELGVTIDLVDAFQRVLARIGDSVYVAPKMGAGQFAAVAPIR